MQHLLRRRLRPLSRAVVTAAVAGVAGAALFAACGVSPSRSGGGTGGAVDLGGTGGAIDLARGGGGNVDLRGGGGGGDLAGGGVDPGGGNDTCSEQQFAPMKVGDPDILLIQDRSGSMADGTPSKYTQTIGAVGDVITQLEAKMSPIEWGLLLFPSDNDCGVSTTLPVPVGKNQGAAIVASLKAHSPNGNTPLAAAVNAAVSYFAGLKDGRGHYLLVSTDGEPNCDTGGGLPMTCQSNAQCPMGQTCMLIGPLGICVASGGVASSAVTAVGNARSKGIKTFVVGINLDAGAAATLNALADAGGTARPGSTHYYPVTDQMSLETALGNISSQIISCSFALQSLPQSNQMIVVTIGGSTVPRDTTHANGWDVDPQTKTLTFYGAACTSLQSNPGVVSVGYTCPPPG